MRGTNMRIAAKLFLTCALGLGTLHGTDDAQAKKALQDFARVIAGG
jgi:hypothetical protein